MTDAPHHHYDPLVDKPPRKKSGAGVAILISVVLHAGLLTYLWFNKFVVHYKEYSDTAVKVDLIKPPPPPPPATSASASAEYAASAAAAGSAASSGDCSGCAAGAAADPNRSGRAS